MWYKLIEIIESRWDEHQGPTRFFAKTINTLYGALQNCEIAFQSYEALRHETSFADLVFSIDSLIFTLQNLQREVSIFDAEIAAELEGYVFGKERIESMSRPKELVTSQIKLLRKLVRMESDLMELSMAELGSFSDALDELGSFIQKNFTKEELFGTESLALNERDPP